MFSWISQYGAAALGFFLFIEESGLPLPVSGDVLMIYSGSLMARGQLSFWPIFFTAIVAVPAGASVLYTIFRVGGRPFVYKYGKYFMLPRDRVESAEAWFRRHGKIAVMIGRFIPQLRVVPSGIAGLLNLPYKTFIIQVIPASIIWVLGCIGIGYFLAGRIPEFTGILPRLNILFVIIFIATIAVYIFRQSRKPIPGRSGPRR